MGVHSAWARTYKDVYQRYKAMQGYDQRYQNGFDCQGLWVEVQVERELNLNSKRDIETYGIARFSEACRARVDRSAAAITKGSIRMGQWMDWENSYYTYSDLNISHIWHVLKLCQEKGWLYKGHRSMPWCARCGTALSQHEMIDSYREMTHLSVYVRFPIVRPGPASPAPGEPQSKESFLTWTTTPWTLPANVALAINPEIEYVRVEVGDEAFIVAKAAAEQIFDRAVIKNQSAIDARKLLGLRYRGPFDELPASSAGVAGHRVIEWKDVTAAEGTGLVHMGDWNISRKRYWGLPLPFYTCANKHFFVLGSEEELRKLAKSGLDKLRELHRPWIDEVVVGCPQCGADSKRVKEVGDCWLDAGIVPFSTLDWLHDRKYWEQWFPADYIVEMVEQVRLWFYSQLFFSVVLTGEAPYRVCESFQPMLAAPGEEFHKSGGNMIDLNEACERVGADIIRWVVAREDLQEIMYFSFEPLQELKRKLLILWNTYSFFVTYANLDGFDPAEKRVPVAERPVMDRWLLSSLARLVAESRASMDAYDVRSAIFKIEAFWEDLSTWYVRRNRARFWKARSQGDSLAAYQTMYETLSTLIRLIAPVMPFVSEDMYQGLAREAAAPGAEASVHLTTYPEERPDRRDDDLERRMRAARRVVELGRAARASAGVKTRMPLPELVG